MMAPARSAGRAHTRAVLRLIGRVPQLEVDRTGECPHIWSLRFRLHVCRDRQSEYTSKPRFVSHTRIAAGSGLCAKYFNYVQNTLIALLEFSKDSTYSGSSQQV